MSLEKVNVVSIYFEEDPNKPGFLQALPCFVLQNGQIKYPFVNGRGNFMWATGEEQEKLKNQKIITPTIQPIKINLSNGKK